MGFGAVQSAFADGHQAAFEAVSFLRWPKESIRRRDPRDSVTLGARRALRPLVLPAEVARLDSLAGYLKFPGAWPVARIKLRYRKRPQVAERFVPRVEEKAGAGQVDMPEDDGAERPGEAKGAIEQAPEAEAAVDLWESDPLAGAEVERDMTRKERDRSAVSRSGLALSPSVSDANEGKMEIVRTDPDAERLEADAEPLEATQPEPLFAEDADADGRVVGGAARADVDLDIGPDEDGKPPRATANRTDMRGRNGSAGARPEGGMIPI